MTQPGMPEPGSASNNDICRTLYGVVMNIGLAVVTATVDGRIEFVNPAFTEVTGYDGEEAIGCDLWTLQFAKMDPGLREDMKQMVLDQGEWRGDMPNWKKSGALYWESVSISGIRNGNAAMSHIVMVKEDITERKRTEEKLFESEERFKTFMDNSPAVAWMKDSGGRYIYLNRAYRERLCEPDQDWIGRTVFDVLPEDRAWALWENDRQVLTSGNQLIKIEEILGRDGPGWWWNFRFPFFDAVGKKYVGGIGIDINEQRRAEEALKQSEELLRKVMENLPVGVWITDRHGTVIQANPAAHEIWGGARYVGMKDFGEYKGRWMATGEPVAAEDWGAARAITRGEISLNDEIEIEGFDGSRKVILNSSVPIKDEKGEITGAIAINQEITERKRAEQERERLLEEVQRSNQELQQFAYVASHDLQEPLRMISSYMQLLEKKYKGQLDEKAETYIRYAVDGAARMQRMIEGLLSYSRIASEINRQPADTGNILSAALANLEQVILESGGTVSASPLPTVAGDETLLIQLFQNLISNGLKYRKPDTAPMIHISAVRKGRTWMFSIRDNGIGIPSEHRDRVFQVFQRLHTKDEYPGTGIGLASCKKIVERHGGQIWLESEPGSGTTFHFTLPADR